MEKKELVKGIKKRIKNAPEQYPFVAIDWEVSEANQSSLSAVEFTKHKTKSRLVRPFYKPISKTFNLSKVNSDE